MNEIMQDKSGKKFVEVVTGGDEHVRITFVSAEEAGYKCDCLRIQIRDVNGHLRQGPEVPVEAFGELVGGAFALVIRQTR